MSSPTAAEFRRLAALYALDLLDTEAEAEYDAFRVRQDREFVSDFDRVVEDARRLGEEAKQQTGVRRRRKKP